MCTNHDEQTAAIDCKQLTKVYKSLWTARSQNVCALRDVSLSIKAGQIVGLIGPNGAGKTTLLGLIAGVILPTRGVVTVCGYQARSVDARRNIGYMPESPTFLGLYSARNVLRYHGALLGWPRKKANDYANSLLDELELVDAADRPCYGFSQGMKQRLALGVALMGNPPILLLDEPSNGLDPIGIIKLRELIKKLSSSGTTILISSHRLGELEKLTSNYIFLQQGEIVRLSNDTLVHRKGVLRIGTLPEGKVPSKQVLSGFKVLETTDTEIILNVNSVYEVPKIISHLVNNGVLIISVSMKDRDIENVFTHLYNERK